MSDTVLDLRTQVSHNPSEEPPTATQIGTYVASTYDQVSHSKTVKVRALRMCQDFLF